MPSRLGKPEVPGPGAPLGQRGSLGCSIAAAEAPAARFACWGNSCALICPPAPRSGKVSGHWWLGLDTFSGETVLEREIQTENSAPSCRLVYGGQDLIKPRVSGNNSGQFKRPILTWGKTWDMRSLNS